MSQTTERFELQTRIAAGNAGLVYRGIDKATRRRVALKLLIEAGLPHPLDGPALIRDMARVRRTAGNNIAQLLEAIDDEDGVVLVYEYADGPNWGDAAQARKLDSAQALDVAAQLLSALAVGEAIRVPHGELKPANLVLGELPGGRLFVWVLDWGLARYRPAPPADALPWMSPEQLAGEPASTAGDLFAMGACLCWLLTGTVPVTGETREQLIASWRRFPANALAQVRPDLPVKFTRWVAGLLDANVKNRFTTVAQARQALVALEPPSPPVLPEIFRPRPKSPYSTVVAAPARSRVVPVARAVPMPRVVAVPPVLRPAAVAVAVAGVTDPGGKPPAPPASVRPATAQPADLEQPVEEEPEFAEETGEEFSEPEAEAEAAPAPEYEQAPELEPLPEPELEPAPEPKPQLRLKPMPMPAVSRNRSGLWLAVLAVVLAVLGGAWFYLKRPGGDAATGGTATGGPSEIVLRRDLAPRATYCPDAKGGVWWCGFTLAHFPPPGRAGVYALDGNLFNESAIDDVIRLTFTESAGRITVVSFPARGSATLPGPANEPKRILVRITATHAAAGTFNVALDLWANPKPASLGPPALSASASKVALPPRLGVLFQKKPTAVATTTLLDALRLGRTPQEALP